MNLVGLSSALLAAALVTGCASVTQGTTHALRIDTVTEKGEQVDGADCTLSNNHGTTMAKSGSSSQVRRSGEDLELVCAKNGLPDAKGRLVSRANAGLAGNIIIGGAIGAMVDHNTGAAYTYPSWVQLVFGQLGVFDRKLEQGGMAMTAPGVSVSAVAPAVPAAASPVPAFALGTRGASYDFKITDRATNATHTVALRADPAPAGEVSFNGGARVEKESGELVRIGSALLGELDLVTPPGGWMPGGRMPSGSWKMRHTSPVASFLSYDLDAQVQGEQRLRIAGAELRTLRVALNGWVQNQTGMVTSRAAYQGTAWISPDLRRVVRFEAKARAQANSGAGFFQIDEVAELVRVGQY
jgi:hypothetical protein